MKRILIEVDHEANSFAMAWREGATPLVSELRDVGRNELFENIKLAQGGALHDVDASEDED